MQEALAVAVPEMEDSVDAHSRGTLAFAIWAAQKLKLSDVAVTENETSFKRVKKDSNAQRGKRMCIAGRIVQIEKEDTGTDRPIFSGLILTNSSDIIGFYAADSTGDLVEESRAKFCGVVTGRYDYSNSAGGMGHAVDMVGVFDIAENRGR